MIRTMGGEPVVCDVYRPDELLAAVMDFSPDAMMSQLTDLPDDPGQIEKFLASNARIRREGTRNLLDAGLAVDVAHFSIESVAWDLPGDGGAAVVEMERMVLDVGGVILRYGRLYGPGTYYEDEMPPPPRIHVDDAARRSVPTVSMKSTVLTIVDG